MAVAEPAKVYNVSGGGSSNSADASQNSSSLPDLLRRHGSSNKRKQRRGAASVNEQLARIELLQDFEFPEASNKIKSTRDGQYIAATGTYKPQMRVWECEQLSLKFERHSDAENVDFFLLSDDWTKSLHIQNDRTIEIHAQGGHLTRLRIPRFGRSLDYHFSSATAFIGAAGHEVFRLNLDQGRFLSPFELPEEVLGVNAVDVNSAHGLCAFGVEGATNDGGVELWDPRSRKQVGRLNVATRDVLDAALLNERRSLPGVYGADEREDPALLTEAMSKLSVTALKSSNDGLNIAAGTNTGHVLLYDLRMDKPYASKDQGFGLPIKSLCWPTDVASRSTMHSGEKRVLSSDAKVIKAWNASKPAENIATITPNVHAGDLNDVHLIPGTGLILSANEATRCNAWYVPELGVAPKWCSFLDVLTEEADEEATGGKGTYEDFKFVDQAELERLGLSHLIGTQVLRPYMHGFFMSLALYDKARLISNPTAYEDARERAIKKKLEKMAESRIKETPKDVAARRRNEKELEKIRVNRALAEKINKQTEKQGKKKKSSQEENGPPGLLGDERFKELFSNPEFEVDETSREFALLNPSTARNKASGNDQQAQGPRKLTAVEEEEAESDRASLDPDQEESPEEEESSADSSDEGGEFQCRRGSWAELTFLPSELLQFDPRRRNVVSNRKGEERERGARLVDDEESFVHTNDRGFAGKRGTFGERLQKKDATGSSEEDSSSEGEVGGKSMTWTPAKSMPGTREQNGKKGKQSSAKGETFGKGLSRGAGREQGIGVESLDEQQRHGREKRRKPNRSASRNAMHRRS